MHHPQPPAGEKTLAAVLDPKGLVSHVLHEQPHPVVRLEEAVERRRRETEVRKDVLVHDPFDAELACGTGLGEYRRMSRRAEGQAMETGPAPIFVPLAPYLDALRVHAGMERGPSPYGRVDRQAVDMDLGWPAYAHLTFVRGCAPVARRSISGARRHAQRAPLPAPLPASARSGGDGSRSPGSPWPSGRDAGRSGTRARPGKPPTCARGWAAGSPRRETPGRRAASPGPRSPS